MAIGCSHLSSQQDLLPAQQSPTLSKKSLAPLFCETLQNTWNHSHQQKEGKEEKIKSVGEKSCELNLDRANRDPAAAHERSWFVSLQEGRVSAVCSSSEAVFPYPLTLCPTKVLFSATWCL